MKTKTKSITVSPVSPVSPVTPTDADLGNQLTAQYHRAVSGMREVLLFGAMLMQIEASLAPSVHVRTLGGKLAGSSRDGGGLKGWLEQHAPEIRRPTAYRFLGITKAVAAEYDQIVGTRIAKKYDLPTLALADPATLDEPAAAKQLELFDYVAGTSQRSWLDQFKPPRESTIGGDTRKIDPETGQRINHTRATLEERLEMARIDAIDAGNALYRAVATLLDNPNLGYHLLPPQAQDNLHGIWLDYGRKLKEARNNPPSAKNPQASSVQGAQASRLCSSAPSAPSVQ